MFVWLKDIVGCSRPGGLTHPSGCVKPLYLPGGILTSAVATWRHKLRGTLGVVVLTAARNVANVEVRVQCPSAPLRLGGKRTTKRTVQPGCQRLAGRLWRKGRMPAVGPTVSGLCTLTVQLISRYATVVQKAEDRDSLQRLIKCRTMAIVV